MRRTRTRMMAATVFAAWMVACADPRAEAPPDPETEVARQLDAYLERMAPFGFSGVVLLARGGDVILEQGYGSADEAAGEPNRPETRFPIESISKQFTAATLLRLEMEGRIDLGASIAEYLPHVPEDKVSVTPHHLLSHTSGIMTGTEEVLEDASRDAVVEAALSRPLLFAPGERDAYSNIGYALLAAIVEHVTGDEFQAHQEASIFAPAGLRRTGYAPARGDSSVVARRYAEGNDNGSPLDAPTDDWNHVGASGILSTAGDLFRWHQALLGDEVLSQEAKEKMYTPVANGYGYGWFISDGDRGRLIEHDGGSSRGSGGNFARYLDEDLTLIILSNRDAEYMLFGARLMESITKIAFGDPVSLPPTVPPGGPAFRAEEYAGEYRFADGAAIRVDSSGPLLELRGTGQRAIAGLLDLEEAAAADYERTNLRTREVLDAVVAGDPSEILEYAGESMGTRLAEMFLAMRDSLGEPTGFSVAGTVPPTGVEVAESMTLFTVEYPERSRSFRFYWRADQVMALGGGGLSEPVRLRAVAAGRDEFVGYHVSTARAVELRFARDESDRVVGVDFPDPLGTAGRVGDEILEPASVGAAVQN